jgi:hypothetical protein
MERSSVRLIVCCTGRHSNVEAEPGRGQEVAHHFAPEGNTGAMLRRRLDAVPSELPNWRR